MTFESLTTYLLDKPHATLSYPFGADVSVFKVNNKMFALLAIRDGTPFVNLKCDPDEALALRDIFTGVSAGYHMNKIVSVNIPTLKVAKYF